MAVIIRREGKGYVALSPEFDIVGQGETVEHARENIREALQLFFEAAPPEEVTRRCGKDVYVTQVEVTIGEISGESPPASR